MLEIETAIMALGPEAQRRVIDWVRSRWVDSNGHANGDVTAGQVEPQFAIRGTPLTSPWPHEQAAKASSFREGVLGGGIGGEDVEQLISAYDEAESLSVVFETGPSAQTTSLFRKLAGDVEHRQRMRPFPQHPTPWWLATAWMLSKLKDAELERAIQNLSFKEGYKAAKEYLPRHWYGPEWWGGEEQWNRAKAIVLGDVITSKVDEGIFQAQPGEEEGVFFAPGAMPNEDAIVAALEAHPEKAQAVEAAVRAGDYQAALDLLGIAKALADARSGIDPALWNTTFRTGPFDAFADQFQDAPGGVLSGGAALDVADAMLDEADWAGKLLTDLRSSMPGVHENALKLLRAPGALERLESLGVSRETVKEASRYAWEDLLKAVEDK